MLKTTALKGTLLVVLAAHVASAQNLDTRTPTEAMTGTGFSETIGPGFGILGQTFTAPTGNTVLTDFSFWVQTSISFPFGSAWSYTAKLYAFDGIAPVGAALFTSMVRTVSSSQFVETNFVVGNLELTAGAVYMAMIQHVDGVMNTALAITNSDTYAGGDMYGASSNPTDPTTATYTMFPRGFDADLVFTANYEAPVTATPEPATITLLATGFAGVFGATRRRRKNAAAAEPV